ncbi:MAG: DUF2064 domain-containing protein [Phycisphaera sp.]|nr:DUF2064 domain-containing protein [Phycisphaera sp.]
MTESPIDVGSWKIAVVIPALNEEASIGKVIEAIPEWVDRVVVGDNGSTDRTVAIAMGRDATVVIEPRRGYGSACLKALAELKRDEPDIVVFLDADFADDASRMVELVRPIIEGTADMVLGSRTRGDAEPGALTLLQRYGNRLPCVLMRWLWGARFSDLGPFRAVRWSALKRLEMDDADWGWTVQMQVRAVRKGLRCVEVAVPYRRRIGRSKISGTFTGVIKAGTKILYTIFAEATRGLRVATPARERLIVMTRWPEPGRTKTRMIPALGEDGAAALQLNMTRHVLRWIDALRWRRPFGVEIRYAGGDDELMQRDFGRQRAYVPQGDGDLGARMSRGFGEAFDDGVSAVAMIGCDCPSVTGDVIRDAFSELHRGADVVLGPANDGGYYLIGLSRMVGDLFVGVDWGTDRVMTQTLAKCHTLNLRVTTLEERHDVDVPDDLPEWERALAEHPAPTGGKGLTVIVPTLNEEAEIGHTLNRLTTVEDVDVIVADGGSTDETLAIAAAAEARGVRVVKSEPGRAGQMNAGAAAAGKDASVLLFCHADTLLPEGYERLVREALADPRTVAGAFTLSIDDERWSLRFIEWLVRWRTTRRQLPYGDQAIFVRRAAFEFIGGYRDVPVMEDYDLIKRLRRVGRIATVNEPVVTSGRTWRRAGVWRTTLVHQVIIVGWKLGVSPRWLAQRRKQWLSGRKHATDGDLDQTDSVAPGDTDATSESTKGE